MNDFKQSLMDFSLHFAVPIYFGPDALSDPNPKLLNGTGGLLKIEDTHFIFTCSHVLEGYRKKLKETSKLLFQIGNLAIEPFDLLVDEDPKLDFAVFKLDDELATTFKNREPSLSFYEPPNWPPDEVKENDVIHFSGFPGIWKNRIAFNGFEFMSLSSGGNKVLSVFENHFYSEISIKNCEVSGNFTNQLGGMSGAPVFRWNDNPDKLLTAELVGMISEYQDSIDRFLLMKINAINEDGSIKRSLI